MQSSRTLNFILLSIYLTVIVPLPVQSQEPPPPAVPPSTSPQNVEEKPVEDGKQNEKRSRRKEPPCKNCFSVNFNDVDMQDWLKTMASLIQKNILIDESIRGKITVISYQKVPESKALDFMKQVLEVKGYGIIEEPNLLKIVPLKQATESNLLDDEEVNESSAGVISKVMTLPRFMDADEMSNIFKNLAGSNVTIVPYKRANSLILTGFARNVLRALSIGQKLIDEIKAQGTINPSGEDSVHFYSARNITAESLANVLVKLDAPLPLQTDFSKPKPAPTKIRAVSHKESNSVMVTANSIEWAGIEEIIRKLDVVRTQILLEVLIAEISSDKSNDFGVDWRNFSNESHVQFNTGIAPESRIVDPTRLPSDPNFLQPRRNTLNGFSLGFIDARGDLLGILRANLSRTNFNVLSSPQVLALNNQEATIYVGSDVPVATRSQGSQEGTNIISNFEYKPAGITLKVTPQINTSGQVTLDFFAEISNIQGSNAATAGSNPIFSKRNVKTNATVIDKQTIVLGGLISTESTKIVNKVPLLGDLPLLGYLFRRTTESSNRRNLMIFMTPHVLRNKAQADRVTDLKKGEQSESRKKLHNDIIVWPEKAIEE